MCCLRRNVVSTVILVALFTVRSSGQHLPTALPEDVGVSPTKLEAIDHYSRSLVDDEKVAGVVTAMIRRGKVVHFSTVGMMDREAKEPIRSDTIFRIASMTKPVVSVAVMMLYDDGKLQLDDPLSKYIPQFENPEVLVTLQPYSTEPASREITIRDLLTHTSGITSLIDDTIGRLYSKAGLASGLVQEDCLLEENIAKLAKLPLLFDPGKRWEYGKSTDVLGRLVECVSGMSLAEFLNCRVFVLLGMEDTHFFLPEAKLNRLAAAYRSSDKGRITRLPDGEVFDFMGLAYSVDYPYRGPRVYYSGTAGLCSTVSDYLRFCQMLLNHGELDGVRLLKPETVKLMTSNQIGQLRTTAGQKFGLGFQVLDKLKDGQPATLLGSYGWGGFFTTTFLISPRDDWAVVAMTQVVWNASSVPLLDKYHELAAEAIIE